jgi:ATP-dependent Clp protease protease subunit
MVHRSWTFAWGNANDLIETAALLEKVDGSIAGQYASKTTKSAAEMLALMDAETWMDAEAAVAAGFCDAVAEGAKANALAWNLSAYERAPKAAPAPAESSTPKPNEITDAEADRRAFLARRTRVLTACAQ